MHSNGLKAVFLDRDGVINKEIGRYVTHLEDFILTEGLAEALNNLQQKNYLLIVISNQGGIAKGIVSREEIDFLHAQLERKLASNGIQLSEIYYCPHHPDHGNCICRKPDSLLLEKAIARFGINPSLSYFIGDADRDIEAGNKAGVNTIKVEGNHSLLEIIDQIK